MEIKAKCKYDLDSVKAFLIGKGAGISITLPSISIPEINVGGNINLPSETESNIETGSPGWEIHIPRKFY